MKLILLSLLVLSTSTFCMESGISEAKNGKKPETGLLDLPKDVLRQEILFNNLFKDAVNNCLKSKSPFRLQDFFYQIKNIRSINKSFIKMLEEYIPARTEREAGCFPFESLLVCAAEKNWLKLCSYIVNNISPKDIDKNELNGALLFAIDNKNKILIDLLVNSGADEDLVNNSLGKISETLKSGNPSLITITKISNSPLHYYLIKLLILKGANVNEQDRAGWTILMHAVFYYQSENIVKLLLKYGTKVNIQNEAGNTALILAAIKGNTNIIKLLLENGADRTIKNKEGDGKTALEMAIEFRKVDAAMLLSRFKK